MPEIYARFRQPSFAAMRSVCLASNRYIAVTVNIGKEERGYKFFYFFDSLEMNVQSAKCRFGSPAGLDFTPAARFYNKSKGEAFSDIEL